MSLLYRQPLRTFASLAELTSPPPQFSHWLVDRWRQAAQDANAQPLLTMAEQKDLEKRHQADQREIKRLQQELRRKDKALAEAAALLIASKKDPGLMGRVRGGLTSPADRRKALEILDGAVAAGPRAREVAALLGVGLTTLTAALAASVRG